MIEAKGLVKRYDNHLAVDNLSFTIEKGHIVGFLGPNGAGKSTTMNMITGYIAPTMGTVTVNGYDIYEDPIEAKKCIGYLPEHPPVYPNMKVREYLRFVAQLKGVEKSKRNDMVEEIIKRVHLDEYANRLIKQLSKGYQQRVGVAQAIVGYPEVLIFDEPTVGLDPIQIMEIRDLIKDLSMNHTIILSSHIMQEISAVCDTVMIINKGKLLVNDRTENLSKYISVSTGIRMEVQGTKEAIDTALRSIPQIERIDYVEAKNPGVVALVVYLKDESLEDSSEPENTEQTLGEVDEKKSWNDATMEQSQADIRPLLMKTLMDVSCYVVSMKQEELSLEDVFLQLTKQQDTNEENNPLPETDKSDEKLFGDEKDITKEEGGKNNASDL